MLIEKRSIVRGQEKSLNKLAQIAAWGCLLVSFCWLFWPIITGIVQTWLNNPDYSHGFFILPLVGYLMWRKGEIHDVKVADCWQVGLFVIVVGILAAMVGMVSQFRTLGNVSLLLVVWGIFIFLFGMGYFLFYGWELFLLVFLLPIPSRIYASLTLPLQLVVTKVGYFFLKAFHISVYREGNILYLANVSLEVVNACSGLRSIITIIMLAYIVACLKLEKSKFRVLLLLFSIPIAMFSNMIRVLIIAVFAQFGYENFVNGIGHTALGLTLFLFSFYCLTIISKVIIWMSLERT